MSKKYHHVAGIVTIAPEIARFPLSSFKTFERASCLCAVVKRSCTRNLADKVAGQGARSGNVEFPEGVVTRGVKNILKHFGRGAEAKEKYQQRNVKLSIFL